MLDIIIQLCVVFDVTQMSYKSSVRVYQAPKVKEGRISVYRSPKVKEGRISVYRDPEIKEGRISVYQEFLALPCEDSYYQVGKVVKGNLVLTKLTR